jgi:hypothetical protein
MYPNPKPANKDNYSLEIPADTLLASNFAEIESVDQV